MRSEWTTLTNYSSAGPSTQGKPVFFIFDLTLTWPVTYCLNQIFFIQKNYLVESFRTSFSVFLRPTVPKVARGRGQNLPFPNGQRCALTTTLFLYFPSSFWEIPSEHIILNAAITNIIFKCIIFSIVLWVLRKPYPRLYCVHSRLHCPSCGDYVSDSTGSLSAIIACSTQRRLGLLIAVCAGRGRGAPRSHFTRSRCAQPLTTAARPLPSRAAPALYREPFTVTLTVYETE